MAFWSGEQDSDAAEAKAIVRDGVCIPVSHQLEGGDDTESVHGERATALIQRSRAC